MRKLKYTNDLCLMKRYSQMSEHDRMMTHSMLLALGADFDGDPLQGWFIDGKDKTVGPFWDLKKAKRYRRKHKIQGGIRTHTF